MTGVLCVGEPLVSLTPVAGVLEDAERLHVAEAGAELNVAIHLARLGLPVRYAGRVGADPFGARIRTTLDAVGVDTSHLEVDPVRRTGLYVKDARDGATRMLYYRAGSAGSGYDALPDAALAGISLVHVTGITAALSEGSRAVVEGLVDRHPRVSFDVNFRPALWSTAEAAPVLLRLAQRADTVFVGMDEAQTVWGCETADDVRALLPQPSCVVVKDGSLRAVAYCGSGVAVEPALPVEVVEPVGAGDAFAAGFLAAVEDGRDPGTALRWGHTLAASVLRDLGDHETTPDRATLPGLAPTSTGADDVLR